MPRPSKLELLSRFFPDIQGASSRAEKEQSIAYNTLACEVVLVDLLRMYDNGYAIHGPGVLTVRLQEDAADSNYVPVFDLQSDREAALSNGDSSTESFLAGVLEKLAIISPDKAGLILLIDNSSAQLFPIERELPARSVKGLLEEFAA